MARKPAPAGPPPAPNWAGPVPVAGTGRRFVKAKLAGLVAAGLLVAWWARAHPMSQVGYFVSGLLGVGVVVLLNHHYRQGQLRTVLPLVLMALALFAVATGGPGSALLAPAPAQHGEQAAGGKQAHHGRGKAEAGDSPGGLVDGVLAACDKVDLCKDVHRGVHKLAHAADHGMHAGLGLFGTGK